MLFTLDAIDHDDFVIAGQLRVLISSISFGWQSSTLSNFTKASGGLVLPVS